MVLWIECSSCIMWLPYWGNDKTLTNTELAFDQISSNLTGYTRTVIFWDALPCNLQNIKVIMVPNTTKRSGQDTKNKCIHFTRCYYLLKTRCKFLSMYTFYIFQTFPGHFQDYCLTHSTMVCCFNLSFECLFSKVCHLMDTKPATINSSMLIVGHNAKILWWYDLQ